VPPEPDDEYLREARDFCERSPAEQREIMRKSEPMISENAVANTGKSRRPWLRKRPNVGRPRSTPWVGRFGEWVSQYSVAKLASDLGVDVTRVGRWARGDNSPSITRAIAVCELARGVGVALSLEDLYERDVKRIRCRIRSGLPPI
jgi:DNA-binding XRE family transcriptional regulator